MRFLLILLLFCLVYSVSSKNNVKALTQSMGQEVIEISSPIKELPQELDEEPSAEVDDEETTTTTTLQPATRREVRKSTVSQLGETRRKLKDVDKIDHAQEDEEKRIEKELAEIYKDNVDYKADSAEVTKEVTKQAIKEAMKEVLKEVVNNTLEEKPIARSRTNFQFQPEGKDVERWRTSVDEITCDRSYTRKLVLTDEPQTKSAFCFSSNLILLLLLSVINYCLVNISFNN